jgi:hypothetical protein
MLFRVLTNGVYQKDRESGALVPRKIGEIIKVSALASPRLIARGMIEPYEGIGRPTPAVLSEGESA